jgi:hypothetical protein
MVGFKPTTVRGQRLSNPWRPKNVIRIINNAGIGEYINKNKTYDLVDICCFAGV